MDKTQLIYRVLSSSASDDEVRKLEQWIALNDENRLHYEELKILWGASQDTLETDYFEDVYRRCDQQINDHIQATRWRSKRTRTGFIIILFALGMAAIASFFYLKGTRHKPSLHRSINSYIQS